MTFSTPTPLHAVADGSLSDFLAHWIEELLQHDDRARRERPYIGIMAAGGTLRDGGWPIYGGDAPTAHAILEAGGFPSIIPPLPFLEGYDPSYLLRDDHTFALYFDVLWPVVRHLDGLVFSGGGDLSASLYEQQPHPQTETPDLWRDMWERHLALLGWLLCIPTLGICRGMHLMNVVLGGTMYQVYWLLGTSVRKIANFAFSSSLFAWHVKLERGKSKDFLLALPEQKPQAYKKNRRLLGERAY